MLERPRFGVAGQWLVLLGAGLLYAAFVARSAFLVNGQVFFSLFDDSMISMRYARNLAQGDGLVWNAGEPAVEGYTNFLWTLWMAVIHLLGVPESKTSLVVMLSAAICLLWNALVVREIAARVSDNNRFATLGAVILTIFSYPLMFWSLRGMEVGLLVLLVDLGILYSLRLAERFESRQLAALCTVIVLALLTRPDAVVPVFVLAAFTCWALDRPLRLQAAAILGATILLTIGAHTWFRWAYYHDPLPNTYYLKVTGTPLPTRVMEGLLAFIKLFLLELWPLFVALGVFALKQKEALLDRKKLLLLTLFLGQIAYSIYVGGDAWEEFHFANRYVSVGLPAAFVLICTLVGESLATREASPSTAALRRSRLSALGWSLAAGAGLCMALVVAFRFALPSFFDMREKRFLAYALVDCAALLTAAALVLNLSKLTAEKLQPVAARVGVSIFLCLNAPAFAWWALHNINDVDEEMTRLGVAIERATSPQARIGVVWAGAPPYFSHRPSVDLLGKSDPVIAHEAPHQPFKPGHNKWDYQHSVRFYHPDLLLQTWHLSPSDRAFLSTAGYSRLPNGIYVKDGSAHVDMRAARAIPLQMRHGFEEL